MLNEKGLVVDHSRFEGESKQKWIQRKVEYNNTKKKMNRTGVTKNWLRVLKFAPGSASCGCKDCPGAKQRKQEKKARIKQMRRVLKKEQG
jgi:hypothetical protein